VRNTRLFKAILFNLYHQFLNASEELMDYTPKTITVIALKRSNIVHHLRDFYRLPRYARNDGVFDSFCRITIFKEPLFFSMTKFKPLCLVRKSHYFVL
jgi:hypothetical protein